MMPDAFYQWFVQATIWAGVAMLVLAAWAMADRWLSDRRQKQNSRMRARMQETILGFLAGQVEIEQASSELQGNPRLARGVLVNLASLVSRRQRPMVSHLARESGIIAWANNAMQARDIDTRINGAIALGYLGNQDSVPALMGGLHDDHLDMRIAAAQALVEMRHEPSLPAVVRALSIPGRWTRQRAIELLSAYGPQVVPSLLAMLGERHPAPPASVARIALGVIGRIAPDADTSLKLLHWASHKDMDTRVAAVRTLGAIGNPLCASTLCMAMQDEAWEVRAAAAKALGRIHGRGCIEKLVLALSDRSWWVRHHAANALAQVGASGRSVLEHEADHNMDAFARDMSRQVLEEVNINQGVPA